MTKTANLELRRTAKANGVSLWQIADKFSFNYSGIDCMSCSTFYRRKNQFLYLIADKLGQI